MNIGVFDSGVGGLWILKHLQDKLPKCNFIFLGDQAHVPYGIRSVEEVRNFSYSITNFLIKNKCKLIIIACNTASSTSLNFLREEFPHIYFVGMQPAVKTAAEITNTKKVGVLATPVTLKGELYNSVVERFAHDVDIYKETCSGLVEQIEKAEYDSPITRAILEKAILPMIEKGIDTIVLSCTHYPFVIKQIKDITNNTVKIIDPTNAIVNRVIHIINENNLICESSESGHLEIYTSNKTYGMTNIVSGLFNNNIEIKKIKWGNHLELNIIENNETN